MVNELFLSRSFNVYYGLLRSFASENFPGAKRVIIGESGKTRLDKPEFQQLREIELERSELERSTEWLENNRSAIVGVHSNVAENIPTGDSESPLE